MKLRSYFKFVIEIALLSTCNSGPPTLDDVTKKHCLPNKPYKCLPYGTCYGVDSYCHPESGTVKSCFPSNVPEDRRPWCRENGHNITLMRDKTCAHACSSILLEDLNTLQNKVCPDTSPFKCPPDGQCYNISEYCQSGKVQSCFPKFVSTNLLEWCRTKGQFDVSLLEHSSCSLACMAILGPAQSEPTCEFNIGLLIPLIIFIIISISQPIIYYNLQSIKNWCRDKSIKRKRKTDFRKNEKYTSGDKLTDDPPVKSAELKELMKIETSGSKVLQRQNSKPSDSSSTQTTSF